MAMPVAPPLRPDPSHRYTVDEVLSWAPDGNRYEVVDGELLVTPGPAPRHQLVVTALVTELSNYLRSVGVPERVLVGPVDFFHGTAVYVQPDLVVARTEEITNDYRTMRRLRLAVEVISPSSARGDRLVKRRAYQTAGVETYWVVDPDAAVVEVWRPGAEIADIVTRELVWRVTPEVREIRIGLAELFDGLP